MRFLPTLAAVMLSGTAAAEAQTLPLLPMPASVTPGTGGFSFAHATLSGDGAAARHLAELVARTGGPRLAIAKTGTIRFRHDPSVAGAEAYRLRVTPAGVTVSASTGTGLFYGATTLWQLIAGAHDGRIPSLTIDDAPAFIWRGVMLDSARHFQPPAYVKALIDRMAMEKLNVLHWHLTDDQAWRIRIDRYPRLTSVGAWRQPAGAAGFDAKGKPVRYGGFYTKAEIREIVAYAAARHITVVPEIEMPGHATAAIAAYPELGFATAPGVPANGWGVFDNLFNTDDKTFDFLTNVLDEVIDLFPSPYIHVGGDEAVKTQWKADPATQARIKALGLKDETELQGWFVARIAAHLQKRGRKLIGWDEILEGAVPESATVMSWRGGQGAITAAKAGHDTVLSPAPDFYLDHFQSDAADEPPGRAGTMDWRHIYEYGTAPAALNAEERKHLLGIQGNLWTEHVRTTAYADRMYWPRVAALAELGWSPAGQRNWASFAARLPAEFSRYRRLGLGYDVTPLEPLASFDGAGDRVNVVLRQPAAIGTLRYTVNGTVPGPASPAYTDALMLAPGTKLTAQAFAGNVPLGTVRQWVVTLGLARTRNSAEMTLCGEAIALRLEDDGATNGTRRVLWGDLMRPCWIWKNAPMDRITGVSAEVGQVPFNFSVGDALQHIVFDKPETPAGEMIARLDSCTGAIIARVPLAGAARSSGVSRIAGAIPAQSGRHDLCVRFSQATVEPMWMLDRLTLDPAK
jgi:hexosaminidase